MAVSKDGTTRQSTEHPELSTHGTLPVSLVPEDTVDGSADNEVVMATGTQDAVSVVTSDNQRMRYKRITADVRDVDIVAEAIAVLHETPMGGDSAPKRHNDAPKSSHDATPARTGTAIEIPLQHNRGGTESHADIGVVRGGANSNGGAVHGNRNGTHSHVCDAQSVPNIVVLAKHFCGNATDFALQKIVGSNANTVDAEAIGAYMQAHVLPLSHAPIALLR